ncbi:MRP2, gBP25 [Angomonas deanei]|nr:MRP2, gBP25 [Angomonas deanei]EPY40227.1 MRP2, gBP25 [Angomonas deanei]|eukprot:EPY27111.1 MRP2, gBP25 [Angomonas deanei]
MEYHKQVGKTNDDNVRRSERAERVVTVTLPPVYIARFLGVLEGRLPTVEVQSRYTNATFAPDTAKGKHHHVLSASSTRPTTGQQLNADGSDVNEETIDWRVPLDVAESLMLERFLTQALHYNAGFARYIN